MGQIYFKSVRPLTQRNQAAASIADLCRVLNAAVPEVSLHDCKAGCERFTLHAHFLSVLSPWST